MEVLLTDLTGEWIGISEMMNLPHGQCMTQVARGNIGQNFKITGRIICGFSQDLCIFWLLWIPFVGLNV